MIIQKPKPKRREAPIMDMPPWARHFLTAIALSLIAIVCLSIILHIFAKDKYPSPEALGGKILIATSVVTIFATYFPWSRLKIGDIEIERVIEKQAIDHAKAIEAIMVANDGTDIVLEAGGHPAKFKASPQFEGMRAHKKDVWGLFQASPNRGFTAQSILNAGQNTLSEPELTAILAMLVRDGALTMHVLRGNEIIYKLG